MLGDLAKDTTEMDLWAFDDDLDEVEETPSAARSSTGNIPAPREPASPRQGDSPRSGGQKTPDESSGKIRMNVNKSAKGKPRGPIAGQAKPESDFDDLEAWEDPRSEPVLEDLPFAEEIAVEPDARPQVVAEEKAPAVEPEPAVAAPPVVAPQADEFSPAARADAKPISLRPHLGLNSIERYGLIGLAVLLFGGSVWFLATTVFRLPKPAVRLEARDFPIKGEKIRIDSAECYWRKPITGGKNADACRLGTLLLPEVDLKISGGSATIRVFFKDDEGNTIGDPLFRQVGEGTVKVAATAGIEDPGIFAAYRTGNATRWTVQVHEIPSGDVTRGKSNQLFEMEIPAERR
jgi:hypothetical protein